ncbi:hypothetical protein FHS96_004510 [Sphingomonas zeicaulis]|uniref:hypothetical protein n=1 Tax=Sphingomonas zeicaulis TaxID=1632740 RepID=UPI003D243474
MSRIARLCWCLPIACIVPFSAAANAGLEADKEIGKPSSVSLGKAMFKGQVALHVSDVTPDGTAAIIPLNVGTFSNGTIMADILGQPREGAADSARGFVGIAFRLADDKHYEAIYIRPTNGRAEDQLRRNHTIQYISMPDFDWERLRALYPGKYESYADVAPGEWIRVRIVVHGQTARLFVNGEEQPALIVDDLKRGSGASGGVALWIGPSTDAYFANVTIDDEHDATNGNSP